MGDSLAADMRKMYDRIWTDFKVSCSHVLTISDAQLPVSISTLSLYLAYFHETGFAASTLCSLI